MQNLCTDEDPCLYFFPGMGYRPAVHTIQRDQYGDRIALVVGDDSPIDGKVSAAYEILEFPVLPDAVLAGMPSILPSFAQPTTPGSSAVPDYSFSGFAPSIWGTSSNPRSSGDDYPSWGGNPGTPSVPGKSIPPIQPMPHEPGSPHPPGPGIDVPGIPDPPPIAPVPLPGGGTLMLSVALGAVVMRVLQQRSGRN